MVELIVIALSPASKPRALLVAALKRTEGSR
jgi:hypothetical protein